MCKLCRRITCHPSCPEAPEPPAAFHCYGCGEPIFPGDEYARVDGAEYCERCIEDMPYCELVPLFGGFWLKDEYGTRCDSCGGHIGKDEEYAMIGCKRYCEDCIDEIPYCELVEWLGGEWRTATEDDIYDGYDG